MNITRPVILVGVDGSAADGIAIEWAAREASMRALPLRIVHVVDPPTLPQMISDDFADQALARSGAMASELVEQATGKAQSAAPGLEVRQEVRPGRVVEELVKAAMDARVLVLGSGQRFDPSRLGLGSVATHVTTHAPCPVVVEFHGGPEGQAQPGFSTYAQAFVDAGFVYVEPNVRGSDGYGRTWLDADNGAKRLKVWTDIEDAATWARKARWRAGKVESRSSIHHAARPKPSWA